MGPGAMRLACRAVVGVWVAGYLAWSALTTPPDQTSAVAARVRPAPPAGAIAAPSEPVAIRAADLAAGRALLDGDGAFPALHCSYDRFRSFLEYARAMEGLGARFVVVRDRRIVGAWDPAANTLGETPVDASFSPRARDYSEEPALRAVARAAAERFGAGSEVMMVVPRALDAGLFGGIARTLRDAGEEHGNFRELRGRYRPAPGGGVRIELVSGLREDGREVPFRALFDLRDIAGLGDATG